MGILPFTIDMAHNTELLWMVVKHVRVLL